MKCRTRRYPTRLAVLKDWKPFIVLQLWCTRIENKSHNPLINPWCASNRLLVRLKVIGSKRRQFRSMQNPKVPYMANCSEGLETVYSSADVVYKDREHQPLTCQCYAIIHHCPLHLVPGDQHCPEGLGQKQMYKALYLYHI